MAATSVRSLRDRDDIDVARIDLEATATAAPAPAAKTPARRRGTAVRKRTGTWILALRDLQWRRRRFAIAIVGTALVFAMTLLLSGLASSFRAEATRTITALNADTWVVRDGISGPFTAISTIPSDAWRAVLDSPTVQAASPLLIMHQSLSAPVTEDVNLFGYRLHGLGEPHVVDGRLPKAPGEVVVDRSLEIAVGRPFSIANKPFRVVGHTEGMTFNAGASNIYMAIEDGQKLAFEGRPVANAVLVRGTPLSVPKGLALMSNNAVRDDLLRPVENAVAAIDMVNFLLWIVAINIIGAIVYLSALERVRDFAVLKATGYSTRSLLGGLCLQSVLVSVGAVVLAMGISRILVRYFPLPVVIPGRSMLILPGVGIAVGLVASLFGVRRAGAVDPALAFGGP
ncbi:MAG: ABC transporter permease [Actinomycetota bacterium]